MPETTTVRRCQWCQKLLVRRPASPHGNPEAWTAFAKRRFCNPRCSARAIPRTGRKRKVIVPSDRRCRGCGAALVRRRRANGVLETLANFARRQHCSPACLALAREADRKIVLVDRDHLGRTAAEVLKAGRRPTPFCVRCGSRLRVRRRPKVHFCHPCGTYTSPGAIHA
jgi:hypothetical protein